MYKQKNFVHNHAQKRVKMTTFTKIIHVHSRTWFDLVFFMFWCNVFLTCDGQRWSRFDFLSSNIELHVR
jgi:hypothetical protein